MRKSANYPPGLRERLVRLVMEQRPELPLWWGGGLPVAGTTGMAPQTLHNGAQPHERDTVQRAGSPPTLRPHASRNPTLHGCLGFGEGPLAYRTGRC